MKAKFGFLVSVISKGSSGTYDAVKNFKEARIKMLKKVGDKVESLDPVIEVDTDKVTEEAILSALCKVRSGVICSLNYGESDTWQYGGEERMSDGDIMLLPALGEIETDENAVTDAPESAHQEQPAAENRKVRAAPAARKVAREQGIDINEVSGTGLGGRVMLADIKRVIAEKDSGKEKGGEGKLPKSVVAEKPATLEGVILLIPSREDLTIAHNLERGSGTVIAAGEPVWKDTLEEYDLGEIRVIRSEYAKEFAEAFEAPLHISAPILLAAARALRLKDFWIFNGFWHIEDARGRNEDKVALYTSVNMGISIDLGMPREIDLEKKTISGPRLRIATLHNAHDLPMKEFFKKHHDLMIRASSDIRAKKLSQTALRDWTGWTFIFNNVGAARHRRGNSLFTPNMSAMLNMGVIGKDGKTPLQIFFDHRLIDGVPATLFLDAVYTELTERVLPEIKIACAALRE